MDKQLSDKELKVFNYIKEHQEVTAKEIVVNLGEDCVGALSRLIREELVESFKKKISCENNPYGTKTVKHFREKNEYRRNY